MITPPSLQKGDKVGIVAPARFVGQENYAAICSTIESYGYRPVRGLTTRLEHGIFAGTDSERAAIIECAAARCDHRAPLIAGAGSNDTKRAVALSVFEQADVRFPQAAHLAHRVDDFKALVVCDGDG